MNFLAHLFLSDGMEQLTIGNFLADYLKNHEVKMLPRPIQEGIRLHRKIDSFTDQHFQVKQGVKRLRPVHRKYAPVILDICYDYILARNWKRYSNEELPDFTAKVYKVLEANIGLMPAFLQKRLPHMIADDWLVGYGTEEGLRFTFSRLKLRTNYPRFFDQAFESLQTDYAAFEAEFNLFFPDVIEAVKNWDLRSE